MFVGGYDGRNRRDEILELVDGDWKAVATMQMGRNYHGVTIIKINDYWPYCM